MKQKGYISMTLAIVIALLLTCETKGIVQEKLEEQNLIYQ